MSPSGDSWYPEDPAQCLLLANTIVTLHFAVLLFVLVGQALVLAGAFRKWSFVRNRWFRGLHLLVIGAVAGFALLDQYCPLTVWENELRAAAGEPIEQASFVAYWAHQLLYIDLPLDTLRWLYLAFGLLVASCIYFVPVNWRGYSPD